STRTTRASDTRAAWSSGVSGNGHMTSSASEGRQRRRAAAIRGSTPLDRAPASRSLEEVLGIRLARRDVDELEGEPVPAEPEDLLDPRVLERIASQPIAHVAEVGHPAGSLVVADGPQRVARPQEVGEDGVADDVGGFHDALPHGGGGVVAPLPLDPVAGLAV